MTPIKITSRRDLSSGAKNLYGLIYSYSYDKKQKKPVGYCYALNPHMAECFGTDIRTVSRWLKELKDKDLIYIEKNWEAGRVKSRHIFIRL